MEALSSMDVLSTEAERFMRVAQLTGLELPATITEKAARLESLEAERGQLPAPKKVPTKTEMLARGTHVDKVTKEYARLEAEARNLKELHEAAWNARGAIARQLSIDFAQERDNLIHALRPIVDGLVEEARPHAQALAPFAPKYDAGTIVRRATMEQVEAWREAERLEVTFGACLAAWRSAWNATTQMGGHKSPAQVPGFDVRWVEQSNYFWTWPERVLEPRLNGTYYAPHRAAPSVIRPTILSVACERPECGFRLATVREMFELHKKQNKAYAAELANRERRLGVRSI